MNFLKIKSKRIWALLLALALLCTMLPQTVFAEKQEYITEVTVLNVPAKLTNGTNVEDIEDAISVKEDNINVSAILVFWDGESYNSEAPVIDAEKKAQLNIYLAPETGYVFPEDVSDLTLQINGIEATYADMSGITTDAQMDTFIQEHLDQNFWIYAPLGENDEMLVAAMIYYPAGGTGANETGKTETTKITDGLRYEVLSETDGTVKLIKKGDGFEDSDYYSGEITIPAKVTYAGKEYKVAEVDRYNALNGGNLTAVNVAPENEYLSSADGILYNKDKSELIKCPIGKTITSLTLPASVRKIGLYAFQNSSISALTVEGPVSIEYGALMYCTKLKDISFGGAVEADNAAFQYVGSELGEGIYVSPIVFPAGSSLAANEGSDPMFKGSKVREVTFSGNIDLPNYVFQGTPLEKLSINGTGESSLGYGALMFCTKLKDISFGGPVEVKNAAFQYVGSELGEDTYVSPIVFPAGSSLVANDGSDPMFMKSKVRKISFSGDITVPENCFKGNETLKSLTFSGKANFETDSVADCTELDSIEFKSANPGTFAIKSFGVYDKNSETTTNTDVKITVPMGVLTSYKSAANNVTDENENNLKFFNHGEEQSAQGGDSTSYGITVNNGKASMGLGSEITSASENDVITLTADAAPAGQEFDKWVVDDISTAITLADENSETTTFTMTAGRVSVTATYKDIEQGGGEQTPVTTTATVTFKIVGGTWDGTGTADKTVQVTLTDGKGTLTTSDVPTGMTASTGYKGSGAWDAVPNTETDGITGDVTYKYSFTKEQGTTNPGDKAPLTGDNSNMLLWIAIAVLSFFGVMAIIIGKKRLSAKHGK